MASKNKKLLPLLVVAAAVVIVVVVAWFAPGMWRERKQKLIIGRARVAMGQQDYRRAEELFTELLTYMPDSAAVMLRISQACMYQNKYDQARQWADKAIATVPNEPLAKTQKASVFRHEAAHILGEPSAGMDPSRHDRISGLCDQAAALLAEAGKAAGANPLILLESGQLLTIRADAAQGLSEAHQARAEQARAAGRADQARAEQQQTAEWRSKADKHRAAGIKELASAYKLAPKDMGFAEVYAEACYRAKRWSEVVVAYRTATTVARPTPKTVVLGVRATMALVLGKTSAERAQACTLSREILTQAAKNYPFNLDIKLEQATIELEAGDLDAAEQLLTKAATVAKPSPEVRVLRGKLLLRRDEPQEAMKLLEALDAEVPNLPEVKQALSQAAGRCGLADRSCELLRQALSLDPDDGEVRLQLARLLADRGQSDEAAALLDDGLWRDPMSMPAFQAAAELAVRGGSAQRLDALVKRTEAGAAERPAMLRKLAIYCIRLGRPDWANRIVAKSPKCDPKQSISRMTCTIDLSDKESNKTLGELGPQAADKNQSPEVYLTLAEAYGIRGQLQRADALLQQAVVAGENDYITVLRAAELYADLGMLAEAAALNQRLRSEDPGAPAALWHALRLALLQDDLPEATGHLVALGTVGWRASTPLERSVEHLLTGRPEQALSDVKGQADWMARYVTHVALARLGRLDQAAGELEAAIKANPKQMALYLRMAELYVGAGKAKQGIDRLRGFVKLSQANVALGIGRIQLLTGKPSQAIKTYQTLLTGKGPALDGQSEASLRLAIGAVYQQQGKAKDEMTVYQEMMKKDSPVGMKGLEAAIALSMRIGQHRRVKGLLDQFAKSPNSAKMSPWLLARMAGAYERIGQVDDASRMYDRIARRLPRAVWPWRAKGDLRRKAGQPDEATSLYRQALGHWPGSLELRRDLARARAQAGRFDEALETLAAIASSSARGKDVARRDRALMLSRLGLYEAAREDLATVLARPGPVDLDAKVALGRCLIATGKTDEGVKLLATIPPTSRQYSAACLMRAQAAEDGRRWKETQDILSKGAAAAPKSDALAWALFSVMLRQGQVDPAVKLAQGRSSSPSGGHTRWALAAGDTHILASTLERQPANVGLSVRLGVCLLARGDGKGARKVLASAVSGPPTRPATTGRAAATRRAVPKPGPGAVCLLGLAEIADGQAAAGVARLDGLLKRQDAHGAWRTVAAVARMSAGKAADVAQLRKAVGVGTDRALVEAFFKRSTTPAGKKACQWAAGSMAARRLRLPALAYRLADAAVQADKESAGAHYVRLAALWGMDAARSDRARQLTDAMVKRFGGSLLARAASVRAALARGEYDQAVGTLKAWDPVGGVEADLAYLLGAAALDKDRRADALKWFERCLKHNPDHLAAANNVAYLLCDLRGGDAAAMGRAQKLAEGAFRRGGRQASAAETLGWVQVKRGQAKEGLSLLQRAIISLADDVRVHYHIAVAYEATGATQMARLHFQHVAGASKDKAMADEARKALKRLGKPSSPTTKKAA